MDADRLAAKTPQELQDARIDALQAENERLHSVIVEANDGVARVIDEAKALQARVTLLEGLLGEVMDIRNMMPLRNVKMDGSELGQRIRAALIRSDDPELP